MADFQAAGFVAANRYADMAGFSQPKPPPSSTTRFRVSTSIPGRSILGGQTSRHAPQSVQAYGNSSRPSRPNSAGERTDPSGPE